MLMKKIKRFRSKIFIGFIYGAVINFILPNIANAMLIEPFDTFRKVSYTGCSAQEVFGSATGLFEASITNSLDSCAASSSQSTFIGADSLIGTGSTTAQFGSNVGSDSRFRFSFSVSEAVFYTLNASVESNDSFPSVITLSQFIPDQNDEYGGTYENIFGINTDSGLTSSLTSGILLPNTNYLFFALSQANVSQTSNINSSSFDFSLNVRPVPLPAAIWLFSFGCLSLFSIARTKTKVVSNT